MNSKQWITRRVAELKLTAIQVRAARKSYGLQPSEPVTPGRTLAEIAYGAWAEERGVSHLIGVIPDPRR